MGVSRKFLRIFLILSILINLNPAFGQKTFDSQSSKTKCHSLLRQLIVPILGSALGFSIFAGVQIGPTLYHDYNARSEGFENIGYAIYLDMPKILDSLSESERALVLDAKDSLAIATLFTKKLTGAFSDPNNGFTFAHHQYFPPKRYASSFLEGHSSERGVCRHKALILQSILNKLGIEAVAESVVMEGGGSGHAWVYLPSKDLVLDPTNNIITDKKSFTEILNKEGLIGEHKIFRPDFLSRGLYY